MYRNKEKLLLASSGRYPYDRLSSVQSVGDMDLLYPIIFKAHPSPPVLNFLVTHTEEGRNFSDPFQSNNCREIKSNYVMKLGQIVKHIKHSREKWHDILLHRPIFNMAAYKNVTWYRPKGAGRWAGSGHYEPDIHAVQYEPGLAVWDRIKLGPTDSPRPGWKILGQTDIQQICNWLTDAETDNLTLGLCNGPTEFGHIDRLTGIHCQPDPGPGS